MSNSSFFNSLDYVFIALMLLSSIAGFVRGFTKEILSFGAWIGSGFIALLVAPMFYPFVYGYVSSQKIAQGVSVGIAYIVILVILLLITGFISRKVKDSALSSVDRAMGLIFGLFRSLVSLVFVCVFLIVFEVSKDAIHIVKNSKITTLLYAVSESMMPNLEKAGIISYIRNGCSSIRKSSEKHKDVVHRSIGADTMENLAKQTRLEISKRQ